MFKITINEIVVTHHHVREWKQVADTGGRDGGALYDYVTDPESKRAEKDAVTVYEQVVEDLDISRLVTFINAEEPE